MSEYFRYYQWDGTQDIGPLDPDEILAGLTDDLMNFGDLEHALRNLLQRGTGSQAVPWSRRAPKCSSGRLGGPCTCHRCR